MIAKPVQDVALLFEFHSPALQFMQPVPSMHLEAGHDVHSPLYMSHSWQSLPRSQSAHPVPLMNFPCGQEVQAPVVALQALHSFSREQAE